MDISKITESATQAGLGAIASIRKSLGLADSPVTSKYVPKETYKPFEITSPALQSKFLPTTNVTTFPKPQPQAQPQMSVTPKVKASQVMSVRQPEPKAIPFQTFTPRVPEAETNFGKFIVNKGVLPLNTGIAKISDAWNNTDNKGGLERALTGLEGVGLIATIPNELFIQPIYDSIKLAYKANRTGKVTQDDINNFLLSSGGEKGTLFDALGTTEADFAKQYGDTTLAVARFADFAPELINVPGLQAGEAGQTTKFAREVKLAGKGAEDLGKVSKAKKIDEAIKAFEKESGTILNDTAKAEIKKTAENPKQFLNKIEQKAPSTTADLITEARKYKTPEEFVKAFNQVKQPVVTNPALLKFRLDEVINNPLLFQKYPKLANFKIRFSPKGGILKGEGAIVGQDIIIADKYIEKIGDLKKIQEIEEKLKPFYKIELEGGTLTPEQMKIANELFNQKDDLKEAVGASVKISDDGIRIIAHEIQHAKQNITGIIKGGKDDNLAELTRLVGEMSPEVPNYSYWVDRAEIEARSAEDKILNETKLKNIWNEAQKASQEAGKLATTGEKAISEVPGGIPPSGNIPPSKPQEFKTIPTKERKFPVTVKNAEGTAQEVKNILKDRIDLYSPIKNKDEFAKATKFVNENAVDNVIDYIKYAEDPREVSYIGQALMSKLQKEGNFSRVIDVLDIVSEQGTKLGQAIQALSVWGRLTPEGALKTAQSAIRKYNSENKLIEGASGFIKLTESKAKEITNQAKLIGKTTDETQRLIEIAKLQNLIAKVTPASLGQKISGVQTLAQLLNPKTFIRNVLGNAIFGSVDSLAQTFATPLDMAISLFTKKRTIAPASLERQFAGGYEGLKAGLREALAGADTTNLASQFDLPKASVFDSKIMQGLEKALNVTLKAPDRAFYEATYADTLAGLMKLNKTNKPTKEMIEIANYEALRRTFQDENRVSKFFQSQKQSWNRLGIKGFGLGDLVLKYPKTPANLLVRSAEYTPLGYVTAVYELARPLMGQAFNQRAFVNNIARATVGTGIFNLGYALAKQGIITPRPNSDTDARNAQDLQGLKSYSFNVSALKRYVMSGLDSEAGKPQVGDQVFSYDWAQPAVLPLAMGANTAENNGKIKDGSFADKVMLSFGPLASEIISSSDTLTEQPLLQGLKTFYQKRNLQEGLIDTLVSSAGSFVPTLLNQINQYTDNASRETYSPDYFQSAYNKFASRVPLLAQKLPQRADILGRPKERFPNASNTFFNVFFNPAFVDEIKANPVLNEVISIYEDTGEKTQFPRVVQKSIKVNGENMLLDTQQLVDYQKNLGELSNTLISDAMKSPEYQKLPTREKALFIENLLSDANKITKIKLFNDDATKLSGREELLLSNDTANYLDTTIKNKQNQLAKEIAKAQGLLPKKTSVKKGKSLARKVRLPKPKKLATTIKTPRIKKIKQTKIKPFRLKKTTKLV